MSEFFEKPSSPLIEGDEVKKAKGHGPTNTSNNVQSWQLFRDSVHPAFKNLFMVPLAIKCCLKGLTRFGLRAPLIPTMLSSCSSTRPNSVKTR